MKKNFTKSILLTILILGVRLISMATVHSIAVSAIYNVKALNNAGVTKAAIPAVVVKDVRSTASLNAYPNPTSGLTTIVLSQPSQEDYKIRVSNAIGKIVKTIAIQNPTDGMEVKFDLSEMPSGFYFYSLLVNDKMVETKRLVLQH